MRLLPREEKFFHLFLKQAGFIAEASRLLLDGVRSGASRMSAAATEISVMEHAGDEVIHEIFTRLNQTFITPIDPEDIHNVSSASITFWMESKIPRTGWFPTVSIRCRKTWCCCRKS